MIPHMADKTTKMKEAHTEDGVQSALLTLEKMSTARDLANLARFGITATRPFGVSMANLKVLAKRLGPDHELAAALWVTGRYEARMLATLIDEPARVTPAQMERWCRDFDNWGICDTACFALFDRTPHAWAKVSEWSDRRGEFARRAAFALLACLALHDKDAADEPFLEGLRLIEQAATDDRNFVKKGVSWAIRLVGRRNATLNAASVAVARRLSSSENAAARWVGKGAVKELTSAAVRSKLAGRRRSPGGSKAAASPGKPTRRRIRD
jgi:3-methyladenine DNA glycosylase AlkD